MTLYRKSWLTFCYRDDPRSSMSFAGLPWLFCLSRGSRCLQPLVSSERKHKNAFHKFHFFRSFSWHIKQVCFRWAIWQGAQLNAKFSGWNVLVNPPSTQRQNSFFGLKMCSFWVVRTSVSFSSPSSPPWSTWPCSSPSSRSWKARCRSPSRTWAPPPRPGWPGTSSPSSSPPSQGTQGNALACSSHPAYHWPAVTSMILTP